MIVDAHVHVYPPEIEAGAARIAEKEPWFAALSSSPVQKWADADRLIEQMDRDGVDVSWVFGFAFQDMGLCRCCNDYVLEAAKRFPERIVPFVVVPPLHPETEEEILRCREAGARGVGELFPDGQEWDISDLRQTWRLAATLSEANMPLLVHTAEPVGHAYEGKGRMGPREAATLCINHPELVVLFAHMGGGLWQYETMPEMRVALANAWYDTAALPFLYDESVLRAVFAAGVGEKLLYGSDFPILGRSRYQAMFEKAQLDALQMAALSGGNAKCLLGPPGFFKK